MVSRIVILVAAIVAFEQPALVDALARLSNPPANAKGDFFTNPSARIDDTKVMAPAGHVDGFAVLPPPPGQTYSSNYMDYEASYAAFHEAFASSNYKTLREFVDTNEKPRDGTDKECGFSQPTGTPHVLPEKVEWLGFNQSLANWGPCEVWCDDELAFQGDNCRRDHPDGALPYDRSKCIGKKRMRTILLTVQLPLFQVYPYCSTLEEGDTKPTQTRKRADRTRAPGASGDGGKTDTGGNAGGKDDALFCDYKCPTDSAPVCGSNGQTYVNRCEFERAYCKNRNANGPNLTVASEGACGSGGARTGDAHDGDSIKPSTLGCKYKRRRLRSSGK